jgi:AcrR family transcriptional regulator
LNIASSLASGASPWRQHLASAITSIQLPPVICQPGLPDRLGRAISTRSPSERRYGGKTASQRRARRRQLLLDAGLELFGTLGYAATTIEGLCARAGLNPRYFYEQFSGREQLLAAVYERHVEQVLTVVRAAIADAGEDRIRRLETGLRAFVDATLDDELGARVNYFEMVGVSRELDALRRRVLGDYAHLIASESQGLPGAAVDAPMVAVALVGATDGLIIDWLSGDRARPRETIVDTLLTIFGPVVG